MIKHVIVLFLNQYKLKKYYSNQYLKDNNV